MAALPAFGQLEPNTIMISATRQINLQPDQAVFGLSVTSGLTVGLDQIVAALSGLNITAANLSGIGNNYNPPSLQWNFTLNVPFSSLTQTIGSLIQLQQAITVNNSGLALTFNFNGTQVSPQVQQSQSCSTSDLIADATAHAQKLASAAGLALGPILKLSNIPPSESSAPASVANGLFVLGDFSEWFSIAPSSTSSTPCSLVAQFQLHS
jgi:hypothetical protein